MRAPSAMIATAAALLALFHAGCLTPEWAE